MSMMNLSNGNNEIVMSNKDLSYIAGKYLGSEFENAIETIINEKSENEIYAKEKINSDLDSYEWSMEAYRNALQEVQEIAEQLEDYATESSRLSRDKIITQLRKITSIISSEL